MRGRIQKAEGETGYFWIRRIRPRWVAGAVAVAVVGLSWMAAGRDEGEAKSKESAIPEAYPVDRYREVWNRSPFQLRAATEVLAVPKTLARDFVLTGLIEDGEKSIAYLQNRKTGEMIRLATNEPVDGFELMEADANPDPRAATVRVRRGAETATLRYDEITFVQGTTSTGGGPLEEVNRDAPSSGVDPSESRQGDPAVGGGQPSRPPSPNQRRITSGRDEGDESAVNPAALRIQQLRERQQRSGEQPPTESQESRSRRRVVLPSSAAQP